MVPDIISNRVWKWRDKSGLRKDKSIVEWEIEIKEWENIRKVRVYLITQKSAQNTIFNHCITSVFGTEEVEFT